MTTNVHTNKQVTGDQNTRERKCGQHNNKLISILKCLPVPQSKVQNSIDINLCLGLSVKGNFDTVDWSENLLHIFLFFFFLGFLPLTIYDIA